MGWTFYTDGLPYGRTASEQLTALFSWSNPATGEVSKVIASAMVGSVWYAALTVMPAESPHYTTALIVLTSKRRNGEWGYKDMCETMGPYETKCPRRILDLLSPVDSLPGNSDWARDWRTACLDFAAKAKTAKAKTLKLAPGMRVELPEPVKFWNGQTLKTFEVAYKAKRGWAFRAPGAVPGFYYKIPARLLAGATVSEG